MLIEEKNVEGIIPPNEMNNYSFKEKDFEDVDKIVGKILSNYFSSIDKFCCSFYSYSPEKGIKFRASVVVKIPILRIPI